MNRSKFVSFSLRLACLVAAPALLAPAADAPKTSLQIRLERETDGVWRTVDPRTVLESPATIRFRFISSFPGYLYVLYKGSGGESGWLFPTEQTGADNRVEPGVPRTVPQTKGAFVIDGPPGFDITYWIVSPNPLPSLPSPADFFGDRGTEADTLIPKCREGGLRPRGDSGCVDDRAGVAPYTGPSSTGPAVPLRARDIRFRSDTGETLITPSRPSAGLVVYEFRIAHH
jgi:hypothetical protein